MKLLTTLRLGLITAFVAGMATLPSRANTIVSVNFGPNTGAGTVTPSNTNLAGVIPAANWNNGPLIGSTPLLLNNSLGSFSGMTLTSVINPAPGGGADGGHGSGGFTGANAAGNNELMYGVIYNSNVNNTDTGIIDLNFTSTTAFKGDVYIYYRSGTVTNTQTFSLLNGNTQIASQGAYEYLPSDPNTAFVQSTGTTSNGNYVEFMGVTLDASGFTIEATPGSSPQIPNGGFTYFSGVEFVATPEPSTYVMLGLGMGLLVILQLRRKAV